MTAYYTTTWDTISSEDISVNSVAVRVSEHCPQQLRPFIVAAVGL